MWISGPARTSSILIAVVAICGLMVSACGGSSSSSKAAASPSPTRTPKATPTPAVDACALVTAADILSATGLTVSSLAGSSGAEVPTCVYFTADHSTTVLVVANAYPDATSANAVTPDQLAAASNGAFVIANAKPVSGIGDKAVEYTFTIAASAATGMAIFVFKSKFVILIAITPSKDSAALENLARTAAGRL